MLTWSSPCIVLNARLYGETDGIASILSLDHGLYRGLVKGMASKKQSPIWQMGNFVAASWSARLQDQLGYLKGELVRANFASLSGHPLAFTILSSICSVAEIGLLERQPVENIAKSLFQLLTLLSLEPHEQSIQILPALLRWEAALLAELGYGLDYTICQQYGANAAYYVSPKTGKVVTEAMAGEWKPRLFRMPSLFIDENDNGNAQDWYDGLLMTGYLLEKHVFSLKNKSLPNARLLLIEKIKHLIK
ncbi:DNA repair protein RecO [Commensalibacter oyaizuii]|uniref:DNA repair protein RecO n=1 Tax=Commensalibacter oyaizuii TaxID=3043873 RepID=A0ABT6PZA4_9PROT|nr:DNA repair protein RecO [Commensalibacter sp. TBRC 16381]MDI2090144.1 DNA repair protein RecO [Commensalibacter sp. TBRC 16381]